MASDGCDRRVNGGEELAGEARILRVVPRMCIVKVKFRLRGETKRFYLRRASLARTSPQDFAADGLRACARRRLASSLRCASDTGMASGVATRLSQSSSISSSRSSALSERACFTTVLMSTFSAGSLQATRNHLSTHNGSALSGRPSDGGLHRRGWHRTAQAAR